MQKNLTKPFLLSLVLLALVGCYLIFRPFLTEIFIAMIMVSIFYRPYEYFVNKFKWSKNLSALLMCVLLVLVILLPTIKIITYAGQKSAVAYSQAVEFFNENSVAEALNNDTFFNNVLKYLNLDNLFSKNESLKNVFLDILKELSNLIISGATIAVKETTNFIISLVLIILSMFFFFIDGKKMLKKLMHLSPLPNRYDEEIFSKFRAVSYTTFFSTFVTAGAQGVIGAIGFAIVGFPAILAGILIALLSLIPYIGSAIFYVPVGLYYILIGNIWQGIFIIAWGFFIIGTIDNILRTYMIKGRAEVNPIFVFFSILGGIPLFGFWGVVLGPLIVALAVTIFHIYEMEFCEQLDDCGTELEEDKKKTLKKRISKKENIKK
ncbi:MAG: hypothetical protein PWQ35_410 [Patescibacteria group bacterium]|nr:hypothetical protein [Patescibacteria group bacterium]